MQRLVYLFILMLIAPIALAAQSSITEANGESCMGDDKSRRQTEQAALAEAKRLAVEFTSTHISSTTVVENFELKQDLVEAFNQAEVKVLDILEEKWADPQESDCYVVRIKAEVIPLRELMSKVDSTMSVSDPRLPLNVNLWVNKTEPVYRQGESVSIYLQGNKPFYARLIYTDASGTNIQILPNQHRRDNYFAGATILEVPEARDRFLLTVSPPFGKETLTLYASTAPLGAIDTQSAGADVYAVTEAPQQIAAKTRGISIQASDTTTSGEPGTGQPLQSTRVAEFAEATVEITTMPES